MLIQVVQHQKQGRTFIWFEATPKSPETRALLAQFKKGVKSIEKRWKATAARIARRKKLAAKRTGKRRRR